MLIVSKITHMTIVMTYIGNDGPRFTGPFPDQNAAIAWGRQWSVENDNDPRWQTMDIASAYFDQAPTLVLPSK